MGNGLSASLCSFYHVFQAGYCFRNPSGFQTAVRIDPKLFFWNTGEHFGNCRFDFRSGRDSGGVNVIHAGANFGAEVVLLQYVQNRQIRTAGFERNDICVHIIDVLNDVSEFAVAHMGMHLCFRFYTAVHQSECRNCPVQVFCFPVRFPQRQLLPQSSFVYLNNADTVFLQIQYFFPNGKSDLIRTILQGNVLPRE